MEYQVLHTMKIIGNVPYGTVEMCDENGTVVFRLEEKFSNRSMIFASYKILQRTFQTCKRNGVSVIHVSTNDRLLTNELRNGEGNGSSSLYRETMHFLGGIEFGEIELRD